MKNIVICYSEHAIKVSDSYCSGPSNHALKPPPTPNSAASIQTAVTSVYRAKLSSEKQFLIRITWCNHAFSVAISDHPLSAAKLTGSFKTLRRPRGSENLNSGSLSAAVFWDLRRARYESGPEPAAAFYVAITVNSELCLLIGDMERELPAEARECPPAPESSLISRGERFSGGGIYSTRAMFSEAGASHEVLIKMNGEGEGEDGTTSSRRNGVLSVYVDKKKVVEVKRLQWNFRGNQSIFLDGLLIDLMWDVHDCLFNPSSSSSGYGVFLFRTRRGSDARLWLEEDTKFHQQKLPFSFLIFASKNPG